MIVLLAALLQAEIPSDALESIRAEEAYEHVRVLASDEYGGREAGSPGEEKAAAYIERFLRQWALAPRGDERGYAQRFGSKKNFRNVIAVLEGAGASLKGEYVAIGAHFDHLGTSPRLKGDAIFNGADDNASGTAVVLEIAQAFAGLSKRPARSILVCFWSAEEKGLLGSTHFVKQPTVPIGSIVAYLNLDMVGRNSADELEIEGTGSSPQFRPLFERVNRRLFQRLKFDVLEVKNDTDHFPFYQAGVPAVEFFSGYHADYHRASDEAEKVSREKLERTGRLVASAAWELAEAAGRPEFRRTPRR